MDLKFKKEGETEFYVNVSKERSFTPILSLNVKAQSKSAIIQATEKACKKEKLTGVVNVVVYNIGQPHCKLDAKLNLDGETIEEGIVNYKELLKPELIVFANEKGLTQVNNQWKKEAIINALDGLFNNLETE